MTTSAIPDAFEIVLAVDQGTRRGPDPRGSGVCLAVLVADPPRGALSWEGGVCGLL